MADITELFEQLDGALTQMDKAIAEAAVHQDPLWLPLTSLAALTRGLMVLYAEMKIPVAEDVMRRAVIEGVNRQAGSLLRLRRMRSAAVAGVIVVVALVAGLGGGWWLRDQAPQLASVAGGAEQCEDRADGSRLCWLPVVFTSKLAKR